MDCIFRQLSYKQEMWRHLAEHKVSTLGVTSNGIWRRNRREYPHILPFGYQHLNILEPYRDEFWKFFRQTSIGLHSDFHHLSSSQAMCFNLFLPFVIEEKYRLQMLAGIFLTDAAVDGVRFEAVLNPVERTNFDLCIDTAN